MPYSPLLRLSLQEPGDNLNLWGVVLNLAVFMLLEASVAGRVGFALSGTKTLSTADGADDEARCAFLDITGGTGGTVITPELTKWYIAHNGASGNVVVTTDSGAGDVTLVPGETAFLVCDGANWLRVQGSDFGGVEVTGVANPTAAQSAATKAYVDAIAWAVNAGILPGQGGNSGKWLRTIAGAPVWDEIEVGDVAGAAPVDGAALTGGASIAGGAAITGGVTVAGGVSLSSGATKVSALAMPADAIDFSARDVQAKALNANAALTYANLSAGYAQAVILHITLSDGAQFTLPAGTKFGRNGSDFTGLLGDGEHLVGFITPDGVEVVATLIESSLGAAP
jgi:hypothetical protein